LASFEEKEEQFLEQAILFVFTSCEYIFPQIQSPCLKTGISVCILMH
jgi:hypothetical protein